jgi:hypothetical protein
VFKIITINNSIVALTCPIPSQSFQIPILLQNNVPLNYIYPFINTYLIILYILSNKIHNHIAGQNLTKRKRQVWVKCHCFISIYILHIIFFSMHELSGKFISVYLNYLQYYYGILPGEPTLNVFEPLSVWTVSVHRPNTLYFCMKMKTKQTMGAQRGDARDG